MDALENFAENSTDLYDSLLKKDQWVTAQEGIAEKANIVKDILAKTNVANSNTVDLDKAITEQKVEIASLQYTGKLSKQLQLDVDKHNSQYPPIKVRIFSKAHDRFLIIDDEVYLIGASIKDLGKKWFGFTLMENTSADELLRRM